MGYQVGTPHRAVHVRWGVLYAHKATVAAVMAITLASGALLSPTVSLSLLGLLLQTAPCLLGLDLTLSG